VSGVLAAAILMMNPTSVDDRINLVDFARVVRFTGDSPHSLEVHEIERGSDGWGVWTAENGQSMIGVEWDEPRDLAEVEIEFRHAIADRDQIRVQYFQNHWPNVGRGGRALPDDPFHGRWVTAKADWWAGDREVGFVFVPYDQEQPGDGAPAVGYRRTYRLRFLLGKRNHELPPVRYLRAYGPREPADAAFDIRFDPGSQLEPPIDVSVVNGYVLEENVGTTTRAASLKSAPARLRVRYAAGERQAMNRTVVTLRNRDDACQGLSFLPAEAVQYGIIRVPSLGVVVAHVGSRKDLQAARRPRASIPDRAAPGPERAFKRAMREIAHFESTRKYDGSDTDPPLELPERATVIEVPEPLLNKLYKTQLAHLLLATHSDPPGGQVSPSVTTDGCGGLAEMGRRIRVIDLCGLHDSAERCLSGILEGQSRRLPRGRFVSKEGVFGATLGPDGNYQAGHSNLDHGFALWALNEHYRFMRDRRWLMKITDRLIAACDFISRERTTSVEAHTLAKDDRLWGKGLLPPGQLEDTPEWFWWFAVNAYAYRGMRGTAESLTEINDPDAARVARDASAFGEHLRQSCKEAMIRAPVVRLRDGTYIPQQPARSRCRGRDLGSPYTARWGPVHLIDCGVYEPNSSEARWILCDGEHRTDTRGVGQGQPHAFSDGPAFVSWLRHLLIAEHGDRLDLLEGVPAAWLATGKKITVRRAATWFGPMDLAVESTAQPRRIVIRLAGPARNPPRAIRLFVRTPGSIAAVTCNGGRLSTFDPATGIITLPRFVDSAKIVISY